MLRYSKFAFAIVALMAPFALSAQSSDQTPSPAVMQTIEAAFPKELRYPKDQESGDENSTCAAVFSKNADGTPNLIATAYSGGLVELAMVAYTSGGVKIISTIPQAQFGVEGGECGLGIDNLADPEHPESSLARTIEVSFHDGPSWFFTWDGKKLQNITAFRVEKMGGDIPESEMGVGEGEDVVDIDHAGAIQILGDNGDSEKFQGEDGIMSTGTLTLFRFNGKIYARAKTLLYLREYEPNLPYSPDELASYTSNDARWTQEIDMHQIPAPSYQLEIVNGDRDGSNRVTSAKIEINGVSVIQSTEVNQNVETLTREIQLLKENKIKVTVDGPAKSHLYVIVE
jgi:hypothetical protein